MKKLVSLMLAALVLVSLCVPAFASYGQAEQLGARVVGLTATATCDGYMRAASNEYANMTGRVYYGYTYTILGYQRSSVNDRIWLLIDNYGVQGWVSANIVDINQNDRRSLSGYGFCIVTADTCRARSGPGTDYSQAAVCVSGNGFMVEEVRRGNTGKDWYRITVDGYITCWISSGLCDYYPYY